MYDYLEISSLYHYGIKGQKWGIIRSDDDPKTRLASEKNRLKYDEKIAQIKNETKREMSANKLNTNATIALGKQELAAILSNEATLRRESYNQRKVDEQKIKMAGVIAVIAALTLKSYIKASSKKGG